MPIHLIATAAGQLLYEACRGTINGLTKGWGEHKAKHSSSKGKSSSAAIVQQVKENPQWIQAQLQLQRQELADRRELARLQRELMRELQAEVIEVKLKEIQTLWDLDNWFSTLSREETKEILHKGQQQHRLLLLVSPPDISEDCPTSFRNNLKIELQSKLKTFMHQHYPVNVGAGSFADRPVEFYGDYFKQSISDINVKQLQKLLAPVPTVVLYSNISDYEVNFHIGYWGFHDEEVSLVPMQAWDWEQAQEELEAAGFNEKKSLRIIRQLIVAIHKLLAAFIADWYYLNIDATASYEPQLYNLQSEFAEEWFPPEVLQLYLDLLRDRQQQKLHAYTIESLQQPPWKCKLNWPFPHGLSLIERNVLIRLSSDGNLLGIESIYPIKSDLIKSDGDLGLFEYFSHQMNKFYLGGWNLCTGKRIEGKIYIILSLLFMFSSGVLVSSCSKFPVSSPDEQILVEKVYDQSTKTWNLQILYAGTGELLQVLSGHSQSIKQVFFSKNGKTLVSIGGDWRIKAWQRG